MHFAPGMATRLVARNAYVDICAKMTDTARRPKAIMMERNKESCHYPLLLVVSERLIPVVSHGGSGGQALPASDWVFPGNTGVPLAVNDSTSLNTAATGR